MENKIYWCQKCKIPFSISEDIIPKVCSLCDEELEYLSSDIRPIFPE